MLSKLFGSKSRASDELPPLAVGLQQSILAYLGMKSIPIMPRAAQQAFQLTTNPNAEPEDFIAIVEHDEGLSARVLKIANSVYYSRGSGSKTIAEAVTVIGATELKGLLNSTTLSNLFPSRHPLRSQLWAHNVAVALTGRLLARTLQPSLTEQAFLGGLMHDIGKLLILQQHTQTYDRVLRRGIEEGIETIEAEVREFPFDHTQVGHLIAERWHFAPELTNVISRHHRPWKDIPQVSVTSLVKAANIIVHALGLGAGREATQMKKIYEPMLNDTWNHLAVPDPVRQELLDKAASTFEDERSLYESWSGG